ncbi:MAG: hypothetical protein ACKVQS_08920 [Fimbriimonadaceae bacterium]
MTKVIRSGKDDGSFDLEYWSKYSPEERFWAVWEMVAEKLIRDGRKNELTLQRTVTVIIRT